MEKINNNTVDSHTYDDSSTDTLEIDFPDNIASDEKEDGVSEQAVEEYLDKMDSNGDSSAKEKAKQKERDLIKKAQEGDMKAKSELVQLNMGLVKFLAKPYKAFSDNNETFSFEDVIQEGVTGLIKGIEKFDLKYDVRLGTYARFKIINAMKDFIRKNANTIQIPQEKRQNINKYLKAFSKLQQKLGDNPDEEQISEESGLTLKDIKLVQEILSRQRILLDRQTVADESEEPIDERVHKLLLRKGVSEYLKENFTEKEYKILALRYGLDGNDFHTFEEIGKIMGKTRQDMQEIHQRLINSIEHSKKEEWSKTLRE